MSVARDTLLEFSISPMGVDSLSPYVAKCTEIVRRSGLPNQLHAMGTLVEGDLDECLKVVRDCICEMLLLSPRVSVTLKMDVRPGKRDRLMGKVASVENLLKNS